MYKISIFHPFTAKAIGLSNNDLIISHSKPHQAALLFLKQKGFSVNMSYFSRFVFFKEVEYDGVVKILFPISGPIFEKNKIWRKEYSHWHYLYTICNPPDVTIINMSGRLSPYTINLSKLLAKKNKSYISMIGGLHMSYDAKSYEYYRQAHHIIVHTNQQKKVLQLHHNFKDLDIRVVPLGVDTNLFKPSIEGLENLNKLLYVGRVSRLKQIEIAIDTIIYCNQNNKKVILDIVGPISDAVYFQELVTKIKDANLEDEITFIGSVEYKNLVKHFQGSVLLLMPSKHESFGMVAVESMACGTPVVALENSGGPTEIIDNGVNGIVCDEESYSENVLNLLRDKEKYMTFRKCGRASVVENYSIAVTSQLILKSVKDVLDES